MNTPTPRTDKAAYSMGRQGEHRDIERWCDLLNESRKLERELTAVTEQRDRLAEALRKLQECDFVITPHDRMDAVREIARNALSCLQDDTATDVTPPQQVDDSGDALTMP